MVFTVVGSGPPFFTCSSAGRFKYTTTAANNKAPINNGDSNLREDITFPIGKYAPHDKVTKLVH